MGFIRKYIISVGPAINIALLVAISSVMVMEVWLNHIPELVPWGQEVGNIYYKVCISIVSSYIFYFIVIHLKNVKDKENINVYVSEQVKLIINEHHSQLNALSKESNINIKSKFPTSDEIIGIFSKVNPNSDAPMINPAGKYVNWIQFFYSSKIRTEKTISKVLSKMPFLDSELVSLLVKIDDCSHFGGLEHIVNIKFRNSDLSQWASGFSKYSETCKALEEYRERVLFEFV